MRRFVLLLLLVWCGLWSCASYASPKGYYLGWAEVSPVGRAIRVSFNPIDCNVCSFVVFLPQAPGVLIAHFDVPLIASSYQPTEVQKETIVARKAEFISEGRVLERPNPPSLVLLKEEGVLWEASSKRTFKLSELMLLTADSLGRLSTSGLFERVEVTTRRTVEADPFITLESFKTSARVITHEVEPSHAPVRQAANGAPAPYAHQAGKGLQSSEQSHGSELMGIPTLARISAPEGKDGMKSLSGCCHILLFYGLGPTDLPYFTSGELALKALTDEEAAVAAFGKSPFIRTRNGLRYLLSNDPVFHSDVGESHQDQCLATFAALNLPLDTPIHLKSRSYRIADLLSESVANFSFDQKELAWTALAYAKYLPQKKEWANRFRERTSFSRLVQYLLQRNLNSESCAGMHIFQALIQIGNAERKNSVLDKETRKELDSYLTAKLKEVVRRQQEDGSWSKQWCDSVNAEIGTMTSFQMSFLVTGHLLEVLNILDSQMRPPHAVYVRAAEWLARSLNSAEIRHDGSWVCPFTHAARTAREIQTSSRTNRLSVADTFHHTE